MARFTVSIEDRVKQKLDEYAEANGYNRSQALETILLQRFGLDDSAPEPTPDHEEPSTSPPAEVTSVALMAIYKHLVDQYQYLSGLHDAVCANGNEFAGALDLENYNIPDSRPHDPQWMETYFLQAGATLNED